MATIPFNKMNRHDLLKAVAEQLRPANAQDEELLAAIKANVEADQKLENRKSFLAEIDADVANEYNPDMSNDDPPRDAVVVVFDARDVTLPEGILADPQEAVIKPNARILAAAGRDQNLKRPLIPVNFCRRAMVSMLNIIGGMGVGWFTELWRRGIPASWRE